MNLWQRFVQRVKQLVSVNSLSAAAALGISLIYLIKSRQTKTLPEVKLSYFLLALKNNLISEVVFDGMFLVFRGFNTESWYQTNALMLKKDRVYKLLSEKPEVSFLCVDKKPAEIQGQQRLGAQGNYLKNQQPKKGTGVTFDQIYGLNQAKKQLFQIIEFLSDPKKFQSVGARLRRGVMIYGPPGTGKTMLAKATATESKVSFIYCSATEFQEVYVGLGAKRVRELFTKARESAPCIIFIDEIDSIAYKRKNQNFGTNDSSSDNERVNTLNQLLTEIDGFNQSDNVVVIAATNRIQTIDDAFMRSGRFDVKIQVKLPNRDDRLGILKLHLKNKKHNSTEGGLIDLANRTVDFSGADMENIANESAYIAIEDKRDMIEDGDLMRACDKLLDEKRQTMPQGLQMQQF